MTNTTLLAPWLRRFLLEYLVAERNLSLNTQRSYRDTFRLLLPPLARSVKKSVDRLAVEDLSPERIKTFLADVEQTRHCGIATRNQRLAAIRSLAHFIGQNSPEHLHWCGQIRVVSFKKAPRSTITYLEKPEMDALLAAARGPSPQQQRDYALLLFLYNTGARADEAAQVTIADLGLAHVPKRDHSSVVIRGKGNKLRRCPLWPQTVSEIVSLVQGRRPAEHVFLNRRGQPITRFGIHTLVERYVQKATVTMPSLKSKRISPHSLRHYVSCVAISSAGVKPLSLRQTRVIYSI
jgi:integrase/recombinase XerD